MLTLHYSAHITTWLRSDQKVKISDQKVKPSLQNDRSYSHVLTHTLSAVYEPHLPLQQHWVPRLLGLCNKAWLPSTSEKWAEEVLGSKWGIQKQKMLRKCIPKASTAWPKSPKKPAKKTGLVKTLSNLKILCINHHTTFASHGLCCCPVWEVAV